MLSYRGCITDVPGVTAGHWSNPAAATGCTAVLFGEQGAVAGCDVRGASPGTRETDLLRPTNTVDRIHAILLGGGSAYGLAAADGVMRYLEQRRIGVHVGRSLVPIVPAAILFDLNIGDGDVRPDSESGYSACVNASRNALEQGSVGAGTGATVGKTLGGENAMKGGLGTCSIELGDGLVVGAVMAVNAIGGVHDPSSGRLLAGPRDATGCMQSSMEGLIRGTAKAAPIANTTIGVVATNAKLTKAQAARLAGSAHDGLALAVRPAHLAGDGDTMFVVGTAHHHVEVETEILNRLIAAVVTCTSRAIVNGIMHATPLAGFPSAASKL